MRRTRTRFIGRHFYLSETHSIFLALTVFSNGLLATFTQEDDPQMHLNSETALDFVEGRLVQEPGPHVELVAEPALILPSPDGGRFYVGMPRTSRLAVVE